MTPLESRSFTCSPKACSLEGGGGVLFIRSKAININMVFNQVGFAKSLGDNIQKLDNKFSNLSQVLG